MVAVAKVTMNRVGTFANSVCKVVYQPRQFSWTAYPKRARYCQECVDAATIALNEPMDFDATHYHNKTVNPRWKLTKVAVIGNHTFYSSVKNI